MHFETDFLKFMQSKYMIGRFMRISLAFTLTFVFLFLSKTVSAENIKPFTTDGCSVFLTGRSNTKSYGCLVVLPTTTHIGKAVLTKKGLWLTNNFNSVLLKLERHKLQNLC